MSSIEAIKQVLLEELELVLTDQETVLSNGAERALQYVRSRLQAIAVAEKQDPVGEAYLCDSCSTPFDGAYECPSCGHNTAVKEPVYTSPPPVPPAHKRQPLPKCFADFQQNHVTDRMCNECPLFEQCTLIPTKFQPLTDEQVMGIWNKRVWSVNEFQHALMFFARAIEAAHGIKENT